ncbi:MAG: lipase family protein [Candidatus Sulfotelmatobacter sp.]|jgi:predicted lipase
MAQPLDAAKAAFYGKFVLAAYTMFDNPGPDPLRPEPAGIPDGYELGAWIHMSDFCIGAAVPKFYGIVAHGTNDDPETRVIAIRGTEGAIEWLDDGDAVPVPFRQVPSAGRVACGFDRIYSSLKVIRRRLPSEVGVAAAAAQPETFTGSFADQLEQLALSREAARGAAPQSSNGHGRPSRPTVVTGHSLGSALTTLFVLENSTKNKFDVSTLCTFASPRVGNMEFVGTFNQLPITSWRIVNTEDIVPKLPPHIPVVLDYEHVNNLSSFSSAGQAKKSLGCCHAMQTYLHWLDAAVAVRQDCAA